MHPRRGGRPSRRGIKGRRGRRERAPREYRRQRRRGNRAGREVRRLHAAVRPRRGQRRGDHHRLRRLPRLPLLEGPPGGRRPRGLWRGPGGQVRPCGRQPGQPLRQVRGQGLRRGLRRHHLGLKVRHEPLHEPRRLQRILWQRRRLLQRLRQRRGAAA
nr:MAG TPA: hypothetical protein [Caudoviricetes sp.]